MTVLVAAILGVVAFIIVAIVLSRNSSRQKKAAIESLKAEKASIGHYDIMSLANEEIEHLGLRSIAGAEDLSADVLLRTWKDVRDTAKACDRSKLRYVVADGVEPRTAVAKDVHLECDGVRVEPSAAEVERTREELLDDPSDE